MGPTVRSAMPENPTIPNFNDLLVILWPKMKYSEIQYAQYSTIAKTQTYTGQKFLVPSAPKSHAQRTIPFEFQLPSMRLKKYKGGGETDKGDPIKPSSSQMKLGFKYSP